MHFSCLIYCLNWFQSNDKMGANLRATLIKKCQNICKNETILHSTVLQNCRHTTIKNLFPSDLGQNTDFHLGHNSVRSIHTVSFLSLVS